MEGKLNKIPTIKCFNGNTHFHCGMWWQAVGWARFMPHQTQYRSYWRRIFMGL